MKLHAIIQQITAGHQKRGHSGPLKYRLGPPNTNDEKLPCNKLFFGFTNKPN